MKKTVNMVVSLILAICLSLPVYALESIAEVSLPIVDSVVYVVNDNYDSEYLKSFINNGGIVVVKHKTKETIDISNDIEHSFSVENIKENRSTDDSLGKDIATLYYHYGNGLDGVYIVNIGINDNVNETVLINEAINEIKERQNDLDDYIDQRASSSSTTSLGVFEATTTREPKGKLKVTYYVYTIQGFQGKDYYFVKAVINGMPGRVLANSNSSYSTLYIGEEMDLSIGTPTSSTTLIDYGPTRTIKAQSYSVDISGDWSDSGFTIGGGWSYSKTIEDTDIEAEHTTNSVLWEVTLGGTAEEKSLLFYPSAVFNCPDDKSSIQITTNASYVLDSLVTLNETIEVNRTITCRPSSASISS